MVVQDLFVGAQLFGDNFSPDLSQNIYHNHCTKREYLMDNFNMPLHFSQLWVNIKGVTAAQFYDLSYLSFWVSDLQHYCVHPRMPIISHELCGTYTRIFMIQCSEAEIWWKQKYATVHFAVPYFDIYINAVWLFANNRYFLKVRYPEKWLSSK